MTRAPHHVRFARAIALASVVATTGCCPMIPDAIACGHCACDSSQESLSVPVLCDTIHRTAACCPTPPVVPTVGPLAPPDLPLS